VPACGEVFYGNIGSEDRFHRRGPCGQRGEPHRVDVPWIANYWCHRTFAPASMQPSGAYLVSTGRFALRGIGRTQDLYTLDPDIGSDETVARSYERYLAK
jgi:adenylate cyclase